MPISTGADFKSDGSVAMTGPITIGGPTVTVSTPFLNASQTWNAGAVTFTAHKINITNTASAAGSMLADYQVGGTSYYRIALPGGGVTRLVMPEGSELSFSNNTGTSPGVRIAGFGGGGLHYYFNGVRTVAMSTGSGVTVPSTEGFGWTNTTDAYPSNKDTMLYRGAAGRIDVCTTSSATYGDIKFANLFTTTGAFTSSVANGAAAVGFNHNTPAYTTSGAVLARWQNNSVTKAFIDKDGLIWGANNSPFGQRISNTFSVFNTNASFPAVDIAAGFGVVNSAALGLVWYSGTYLNSGGANDAGLHRKAAKIIESNAGTAGIYAGSAFTTGSQTVAQLPAAATAGAGARAFVTDATATTFLSVVAGGGANKVPVVCDGTNWLIG